MTRNKTLELCSATLVSYRQAAANATKALTNNWIILPASAATCLVFAFAQQLFGGMGFGAGMLLGLIEILLISVYYCWLFDSIRFDKISYQNLIRLDGGLFSSVINTAFILFIIKFFIFTLVQGLSMQWLPVMVQFGLVIICNALPEIVYMNRYDGLTALNEAAKFTRDNWIEWFLPLVVLLMPWFVLAPKEIFSLMIGSNGFLPDITELVPALLLYQSFAVLPLLAMSFLDIQAPLIIKGGIPLLFGIVGFNWFMLFRGFLFKDFESGSRRQRMFRSKL